MSIVYDILFILSRFFFIFLHRVKKCLIILKDYNICRVF